MGCKLSIAKDQQLMLWGSSSWLYKGCSAGPLPSELVLFQLCTVKVKLAYNIGFLGNQGPLQFGCQVCCQHLSEHCEWPDVKLEWYFDFANICIKSSSNWYFPLLQAGEHRFSSQLISPFLLLVTICGLSPEPLAIHLICIHHIRGITYQVWRAPLLPPICD